MFISPAPAPPVLPCNTYFQKLALGAPSFGWSGVCAERVGGLRQDLGSASMASHRAEIRSRNLVLNLVWDLLLSNLEHSESAAGSLAKTHQQTEQNCHGNSDTERAAMAPWSPEGIPKWYHSKNYG